MATIRRGKSCESSTRVWCNFNWSESYTVCWVEFDSSSTIFGSSIESILSLELSSASDPVQYTSMCTVRDGFLVSGFVAVDDAGENAGGVAKLLPDGEAYRKKKCFTKMHQNDDLTFQKCHFFFTFTKFLSFLWFECSCTEFKFSCEWW